MRNFLTITCPEADFLNSTDALLVLRQNGKEYDYPMTPESETTARVFIPKKDAMQFDENDMEAQIFLTDADGEYKHSAPKYVCVATVLLEAGYGA